mmetsp:Transcript_4920/g.11731  ORF Transcript_4920/g.11731 Transcript_4920/m.11731 type:complete len:451 (-) Transcript_4920:17-1369(-)
MEQSGRHELVHRTLQAETDHLDSFLAVPGALFSVDPFHDQHPLSRQRGADIGDHDVVPVLSVEVSKAQAVVRFSFVVELSEKLNAELIGDSEDVPAPHLAQPGRGAPQEVHVEGDRRSHVRPLDLDGDDLSAPLGGHFLADSRFELGSTPYLGLVDLPDRSRGNGLVIVVEFEETQDRVVGRDLFQLGLCHALPFPKGILPPDRCRVHGRGDVFQFRPDDFHRLDVGKGSHGVHQFSQLLGPYLVLDQIGPQAQCLPRFDQGHGLGLDKCLAQLLAPLALHRREIQDAVGVVDEQPGVPKQQRESERVESPTNPEWSHVVVFFDGLGVVSRHGHGLHLLLVSRYSSVSSPIVVAGGGASAAVVSGNFVADVCDSRRSGGLQRVPITVVVAAISIVVVVVAAAVVYRGTAVAGGLPLRGVVVAVAGPRRKEWFVLSHDDTRMPGKSMDVPP